MNGGHPSHHDPIDFDRSDCLGDLSLHVNEFSKRKGDRDNWDHTVKATPITFDLGTPLPVGLFRGAVGDLHYVNRSVVISVRLLLRAVPTVTILNSIRSGRKMRQQILCVCATACSRHAASFVHSCHASKQWHTQRELVRRRVTAFHRASGSRLQRSMSPIRSTAGRAGRRSRHRRCGSGR
jgi:hypothetical protein